MKTPTKQQPPKSSGMSFKGKVILGLGVLLLVISGLGLIAWLSEPAKPQEFTYDVVEDTLEQKQETKPVEISNQTIEQQLDEIFKSDTPFMGLLAFLVNNFFI
jgi:flagellar basal body-associated protein FliL